MAWRAVCKLLQKRSIDLLSHRNGCRLLALGIFVTLVMLLQLGEVMISWSTEKYAAMFSPFNDNIGGRSFRERLCLPVPIDVVYTWVNGSDPVLLEQLKAFKQEIKAELNMSAVSEHCMFLHCVPAHGIVIEPSIPSEITLQHLGILYPSLKDATESFNVEDVIKHVNLTAFMFDSVDAVGAALKEKVVVLGKTASLQSLYYTSDDTLKNSIGAENTLIMSGFPYSEDESLLRNKLVEKYDSKNIISFTLHAEKGVAVIKVSDAEVFRTIVADKNMTMNGKSITFNSARLVWDLRDYSQNEDISASRFEDNEELRYSLRSLEKFAPWVRHVFIVTNGQIPSWLNMDSPRLTVVTHEELFQNQSHLPTFSSPAIESHIHRIPGLSDKFIYLNDDVMFGKEVWPDDFYTEAGGQKVYLTWPVPNCQDGCPASWIKDGYCDKSCNNSECEWDGGDCEGSTAVQPLYQGGQGQGSLWSALGTYCNPGCANNWIADRYCDVACNVQPCGFDAGDCGLDNFHRLFRVDLRSDETYYTAAGRNPVYFNYSSLISEEESIDEGYYDEGSVIRSMSIAQKFKVVTLVLNENQSALLLNFSLHGKNSNLEEFSFNFTVLIDTTFEEKSVATATSKPLPTVASSVSPLKNDSSIEQFVFSPRTGRLAAYPKHNNITMSREHFSFNLSASVLPEDVRKLFEDAEREYKDGYLTETGYIRRKFEIWQKYQNISVGVSELDHINLAMVHNTKNHTSRNDTFRKYLDKQKRILSMTSKKNETATKTKNKTTNEDSFLKKPKKMVTVKPFVVGGQDLFDKNKQLQKKLNVSRGRLNRKLLSSAFENNESMKEIVDVNSDSETKDNSFQSTGHYGFLPWEKLGVFSDLEKAYDRAARMRDYVTTSTHKRNLLDTFANSLRHVSKIYNKAYGYTTRKVPAHIAHMIDKNVMAEMQSKFPDDWDETSSHRMRSSNDMQFAFAYFYYLMSEKRNLTIQEMFAELDTDNSGVLSDREIRILATRLFELPLELQNLVQLEELFINCSKNETSFVSDGVLTNASTALHVKTPHRETYYDKRMPQVTLDLITRCETLRSLLLKHSNSRSRFRYEVVGEDEVFFKMIRYNVSIVVAQLDEIRKTPKKFICLNDNIDYAQEAAKLVKAVLRDFYESVLPVPSKFELPKEYRNKFLHIKELRQWWRYRETMRWMLYVFLLVLVAFVCSTFVCDVNGRSRLRRRLFRC